MTTHLCIRPFACIRFFAIAGLAWCVFSAIARSAEPQPQAVRPTTAQAAIYSLAGDFSCTDNRTNSTWSYRLDDFANTPPTFPLLTSGNRDANALWGSDFPAPPMMWSDATGYWGIGKNVTGKELFSTRNGTRWAPGEVLFHPKGGASPARLVIAWTAPTSKTRSPPQPSRMPYVRNARPLWTATEFGGYNTMALR